MRNYIESGAIKLLNAQDEPADKIGEDDGNVDHR